MGYPVKIATCCHCGTKAALKLDKGRHALSCASCGAPLRNLKALPVAAPERPAVSHQPSVRQFAQKPKRAPVKKTKRRKMKKRIGWLKDMAEEVFDFVEDIFD
ncbi:hypothetical protein HKX54_01915 [Sulfitobacter sp. M57]|uniref:hypothetical protein n=1 Tax=unclassified Sulfitobacter TaxID=196795 RepID=UPI0023E2EDFA|nr:MULTISPECIES: hypothetical protein [unclassified Sulfitobacter]MDF3413197.1 hypothetical protein [Sulfitobacter sp. KE5]MDF3421520.1 hypothetical protein [Sulfitobacter sp. KE43]MDF3431746.1 hypothetical protein [Sulfitobacter sp. KE42]MDF3457386.1 hypothetical protein [Sulfitobacter sp. S74]MDF3461289.1 hypothetical protein [Sulfitobacter sp. Ks18]